MGFYISKSVSAGPFRFNLSGSGLGMSVGVKGLRIGTGPRGNYVRMGFDGFYYRASLGPARHTNSIANRPAVGPATQPGHTASAQGMSAIETGNIAAMTPVDGSTILQQINEKMALWRWWPWALGGGLALSALMSSAPNGQIAAAVFAVLTLGVASFVGRWDTQRKLVVIMYDLDDNVTRQFKAFSDEFDKIAAAGRIWNIDTAGRTDDWKRNAGASHLITRKVIQLSYGTLHGVKTNVALPSIVGGRQSIYFLPDVVLVVESNRAGAISYSQLTVSWGQTVFIEDEGVPKDAQVVGYTWKYVNKKGGPDRRFNNNREVPQVRYQQMSILGSGNLRKLLYISQIADRGNFDATLDHLRTLIRSLNQLPSPVPMQNVTSR